MSLSTVNTDPSTDDLSTQKPVPYKYDLRLEIGVPSDGSQVAVVSIFYDLVRHLKEAADEDGPVAVLTATDKLFLEQKELTNEEFQKEFQVDNTEGKSSKVLLGFKIHSLTKLSDLKRKLMHTYLIPNNLFLRQHVGGFSNGVKTYSYGFLKDDHPDHPDIAALNQRFARHISDAWKKLEKTERSMWRKTLPNIFFSNTGILIPINFTKERVVGSHESKDKIVTQALMVSTPSKYGKLLKSLLDIAIAGKKINNLIPFALGRDNPEGYYYLVAMQARFIENHRNIPISNVPLEAHTKPGKKGTTLIDILNANTSIQRVAYDPHQSKYHVSTIATKYREVHQWIDQALAEHQFPYSPQIRPMKYNNPKGNSTGLSYSEMFKDAISIASDKFSASTIKTTPTNPWKTRPPLAITYDKNAEAFPKLAPAKHRVPVTSSTTSETLDEDTIQSAISVAIKKLEEQHKAELTKLKLEMQQKIDEVTTQMKDLGQQVATQTYQALVREESPLVTKIDHAHLQDKISNMSTQLSTIITMFQQNKQQALVSVPDNTPHSPSRTTTKKRTKASLTPEKAPRPHDIFTQDHSVSSATSDPDEGMEECEE